MAINDKENPEEGTPKSKRDIRKERRQMKSINKQREAMGGEKLYKEADFESIKKPFKSEPSAPLSGTMEGIGKSSIEYNDPNKQSVPDVVYKKVDTGGYGLKIKPLSREEFIKEAKNNFEKGNKPGRNTVFINNAVYKAMGHDNAFYKTSHTDDDWNEFYNNYLKNVNEKYTVPSTETKDIPVTQQQATEISEGTPTGQALVKTLTQPDPAIATTNAIQTIVTGDKNATLNQVENGIKASIEAGDQVNNLNKQITQEELDAKNALSNIGDITKGGAPIKWEDTYVTGGFEPESKEDIMARAANAARKKAPQLVIEKLGIQDYYPEIGRNIAVGTFTGSRIGSQTIYSGAGGLLPLGLYDARKRAIAADIKKKEALMDQLKEMPDIAKQYKPAFAQDYYKELMKYVDAYKDNPEGLMSDSGFLKFQANRKGVAENFTKTSAYLEDLEKKLVNPTTGEPAVWVSKGMLEIIRNVKLGMTPGKVEDYFSGKKNIAKVLDTVRALPNALKQGDKIIDTLISKGGVETAINLKTGKEFTEKDIADMNSLIKQIKSPSADYEMFAELKKKFFDFEYDIMAKEWVEMNMADQPQHVKNEVQESMSRYIESQMPEDAIISTITSKANNAAQRYVADQRLKGLRETLQMKKDQFNYMMNTNPAMLYYQTAMKKGSFSTPSSASKAYQVSPKDVKIPATFYEKGKLVTKDIRADIVKANPNVYFKSVKNVGGKQVIEKYDIPDKFYYNQNEVFIEKQADGRVISYSSGTGFTQNIVSGGAGTKITKNTPLEINFKLDKGIEIGDKNGYNTAGGVSFDLLEGVDPNKYMRKESFSEGSFEYGPAED